MNAIESRDIERFQCLYNHKFFLIQEIIISNVKLVSQHAPPPPDKSTNKEHFNSYLPQSVNKVTWQCA